MRKLLGVASALLIAGYLPQASAIVDHYDVWDSAVATPQLPDPNGWDVFVGSSVEIADDFVANSSISIEHHFFGGWLDGVVGTVNSLTVSLYADAAGAPGAALWSLTFDNSSPALEFGIRYEGSGNRGFAYTDGTLLFNNHSDYYQLSTTTSHAGYDVVAGTTYWLGLSAAFTGGEFGWATSAGALNAQAVWRPTGSPITPGFEDGGFTVGGIGSNPWTTLPIGFDMAFVVTPIPGALLPALFGLGGLVALGRPGRRHKTA